MRRAVLFVALASLCIIAHAQCPHQQQGITRWSQWTNKPTTANADVTISPSEKILLDETPSVVLNAITINGQLIFDPTKNLEFRAHFIYVPDGGHLWVGSEECPFPGDKTATIYLHGDKPADPSTSPLNQGHKVLSIMNGGKADLHGSPHRPTWTFLGATIAQGASSLTTSEDVAWAVGDVIVLASTDYRQTQAERVTITQRASARTFSFTPAAQYMHYGEIYTTVDGETVDMRGEVGVLNRNVIVRSDTSSGNTENIGWGGHIIKQKGGLLRIEGVEVIKMGQAGLLGRYPIHYHMAEDCSADYVRDNSIHDTFQRCLTIHGTRNLRVDNNVAYNSTGHCYFIEDGWETGNILRHNLGVYARDFDLIESDTHGAAMFWITHPTNHFYDNAAAGGEFGFWYAAPVHPTGPGATLPRMDWWVNAAKLGDFQRNRAHSCRAGLFVDDGLDFLANPAGAIDPSLGYFPRKTEALFNNPKFKALFPDFNAIEGTDLTVHKQMQDILVYYAPGSIAIFDDFTAYKNYEFGMWARGSHIWFRRARVSDNQVGVQMPGWSMMLSDSVLVGDSPNVGTTDPTYNAWEQGRTRPYGTWIDGVNVTVVGYRNYDNGGPDFVINNKFYNFQDFTFQNINKVRKSGAISHQNGPHVIPPRNKFLQNSFFNTDNRILSYENRYNENAHKGVVWVDHDGTLSEDCGSVFINPYAAHQRTAACAFIPAMNVYHCPAGAIENHRYLAWGDNLKTNIVDTKANILAGTGNSTGYIYRAVDGAGTDYMGLTVVEDFDGNSQVRTAGWDTNVPANTEYVTKWGANNKASAQVYISINYLAQDEWVRLAIPYPSGTTFHITDNWDGTHNMTQVATAAALGKGKFFYDSTSKLLWVHLENEQGVDYNWHYGLAVWDSAYNVLVRAACPNNDCTQTLPAFGPSIVPTRPAYAAKPSLCEKDGGIPNANFKWTQRPGTSEYYIFGDSLSEDWGTWSTNWDVVGGDKVYAGSGALRANLSQWDSVFFYVKNTAGYMIRTDAYTHIELAVRVNDNEGDSQLYVYVQEHETDGGATYSTQLTSPYHTNEGLISDTEYRLYRIPLAALGITNRNYIHRLWLQGTGRPMTIYTDSIKLATFDVESYAAPLSGRTDFGPPDASPVEPDSASDIMVTISIVLVALLATLLF